MPLRALNAGAPYTGAPANHAHHQSSGFIAWSGSAGCAHVPDTDWQWLVDLVRVGSQQVPVNLDQPLQCS